MMNHRLVLNDEMALEHQQDSPRTPRARTGRWGGLWVAGVAHQTGICTKLAVYVFVHQAVSIRVDNTPGAHCMPLQTSQAITGDQRMQRALRFGPTAVGVVAGRLASG